MVLTTTDIKKEPKYKRWTQEETAIVLKYYDGSNKSRVTIRELTGFSRRRINRKIFDLGLTKVHPSYLFWTEEQKELVRTYYNGTMESRIKLSNLTGHPRNGIDKMIVKLGLSLPRRRVWTSQEIKIILDNYDKRSVKYIARKLLNRSECAVIEKIKTLKLSRRMRDGWFTQEEVSEILGVDSQKVRGWIRRGELQAKPQHHDTFSIYRATIRIELKSLKKFIIEHASELTGRNVNISLLVYVLTG